jgi:dihydrodipicolinate synthase/N-acetylneuraminate lyase
MPALVTPFSRVGEIDLEAHTANLRALSEAGMEGFVIGGSTGEGPYLEPGDRQRLVRAGRRRKAFFMVGIAAESTRVALSQLQEASDGGADAVLVMTPTTLSRGRDEAVLRFYRTVADASSLPVFLYSVPGVTAYNLPVEAIAKLARHERIVGIKDSSGDVVRMQSIIDAAPPEFLVYSGSSRALTAAVAIGCHGAITASGNYVPDLVLRTLAAARESSSKARRLQKQLSAISADVEAHGIPGVKAAAKAAGLDPGHPREPLTRLSKGAETSIAKLI